MRRIVFITVSAVISQLAWTQQPRIANSIKAIVGGQKVITQWDVELLAVAPDPWTPARSKSLTPAELALAQKELETQALLIMSIKSREGYAEPPGIGELLLKGELKRKYDNERKDMTDALRKLGKTVQQREAELWDQQLLQTALRDVRQSVQVSPAAIKKYYSENPNINDKGLTVDLYAIRISRDEEGVDIAKVQEFKNGVKSLEDFKKLAGKFDMVDVDHKGIIHKKDPVGLSKELAGEAFTLLEKEAGVTLDQEFFHLLYVEKRWDKYEIPLSEVYKIIKVRLAQEIFEQKMSQKEKRVRSDVLVYYPPIQ